MEIRLASTRGFCAGVDRAIEIVKKVIEIHGAPVYVKHEVVHNKTVVEELKGLGAIFVEILKRYLKGRLLFTALLESLKQLKLNLELEN